MAGSLIVTYAALAALLLAGGAQAQAHEDGGALGARVCAAADADRWHFPHPSQCNRFVKCDVANGLSSIITCPDGLLYNAAASVCDYPANVECGAGDPDPNPVPDPDPAPNTKPPRPNTTTKRPRPTTTTKRPAPTTTTKRPRPTTTTKRPAPPTTTKRPAPTTTTKAPSPPTGDFSALCRRYNPRRYHVPHPSDATKFYKCEWASGVAWEFDCPAGLVFKAPIQVCDWP